MFRWTETEVSAIIDMVARCVTTTEDANKPLWQLLQELSGMLGAHSWRFETRDTSNLTPALFCLTSSGQLDDSQGCLANWFDRYQPQLRAAGSNAETTSPFLVTTACQCQSTQDAHPLMACLWSGGPDLSHCVEFSRPAGKAHYTDREQALLRVLVNQLGSLAASRAPQNSTNQPRVNLSPRQSEVLDLLIEGKNCKQIASQLQLSVYTVNDYIKAIYRRYDVSCRAELLASVHFGA